MGDASVIANASLALLAVYLGFVLWRGATTRARRALARMLFELGAYSSAMVVGLTSQDDVRVLANDVGLSFAVATTAELAGFGLWYCRGAQQSRSTLQPASLFVVLAGVVVALDVVGVVIASKGAAGHWPRSVLLFLALASTLAAALAFGVAWWRGVRGSRGYFAACLWPLAPIAINLVDRGVRVPASAYLTIRSVCLLMFVLWLLASYLDEGHEPISLRDRISSGALMGVLAFGTVSAHLLLPLGTGSAPAAALRLFLALGAAAALVVVLSPIVFRKSVLHPLELLSEGFARVESGVDHQLRIDRTDELGGVARSFNSMVRALGEGRGALAEKLQQLESKQLEIEALNEELRRQIAARSRQLAEALKDVVPRLIEPGMIVDGRYAIEDRLGAGGMGVVFRARRLHDDRSVALKVVLGSSPEDAVRFMREAEIAATLDHPNLVSVIDVGMDRGTPYFVMERLVGGSLAEHTTRFGDRSFLLPILLQIATGIAALHAVGVLHRDLKPANVLLDGDHARPVAKIGDFGIASVAVVSGMAASVNVDAATARGAATAGGAIMGTLPYMAPELVRGASAFGPPSDVFAFGALAWEVLTGKVPFAIPAVFLAQSGSAITRSPLPSGFEPAEVGRLLESCLASDPTERPTVDHVVRALTRVIEAQ